MGKRKPLSNVCPRLLVVITGSSIYLIFHFQSRFDFSVFRLLLSYVKVVSLVTICWKEAVVYFKFNLLQDVFKKLNCRCEMLSKKAR